MVPDVVLTVRARHVEPPRRPSLWQRELQASRQLGQQFGIHRRARLQADQAEADTRVARAHAEETRSAAIAGEQEMKALTAENRALVVLAEAEVPEALAQAYRIGRLRGTASNTTPAVTPQ